MSGNNYLRTKLCNKLIKENLVSEYDIIKHSFANDRLNSGTLRIENKNDKRICCAIPTRADALGVVVYG